MAKPQLTRTSFRLLKNKSSSDTTQIPAAGAPIQVHRQGATALANHEFTEQDTFQMPVSHPGLLRVGDTVYASGSTDPDQEFYVSAIGDNFVELQYSGYRTVVSVGERLWPKYDPNFVFSDPAGQTPLASIASDANGIASFFVSCVRFDYVLTNAGSISGIYLDQHGGWSLGDLGVINARDFPSLETAVDAVPAGGTLYIPAGTYHLASAAGVAITRPMTIQGDGVDQTYVAVHTTGNADSGRDSYGFRIVGLNDSTRVNLQMRDLTIINPWGAPGTKSPSAGHGIYADTQAGYIGSCTFERVKVRAMGGSGFASCATAAPPNYCDQWRFRDSIFMGNMRHGMHAVLCSDMLIEGCVFIGNGLCGVLAVTSGGLAILKSGWNGNGKGFSGTPAPMWDEAQLYINNCGTVTIDNCDFEAFIDPTIATPRAIGVYWNMGGRISGCRCYNGAPYRSGSAFIEFLPEVRGMTVLNNAVIGVDWAFVAQRDGNPTYGTGIQGNFVTPPMRNTPSTPNNLQRFYLPNQPNQTSPPPAPDSVGGNIAFIPLTNEAPAQWVSGTANFIGGLRLPVVDHITSFTNSQVQEGTLAYDVGDHKLKVYTNTGWVAVH